MPSTRTRTRSRTRGTCPSCDEKIGVRSSFCMHCGVEFHDHGGGGGEVEPPSTAETLARAVDRVQRFDPPKLVAALLIPLAIAFVLLEHALTLDPIGAVASVALWVGFTLYLFERGTIIRAAVRSVIGAAVFMIFVPIVFWAAATSHAVKQPLGIAMAAFPLTYAAWAFVTVEPEPPTE